LVEGGYGTVNDGREVIQDSYETVNGAVEVMPNRATKVMKVSEGLLDHLPHGLRVYVVLFGWASHRKTDLTPAMEVEGWALEGIRESGGNGVSPRGDAKP